LLKLENLSFPEKNISGSGPPQQGSTKLKYRNSSPGVVRRPRTVAPSSNASRLTFFDYFLYLRMKV